MIILRAIKKLFKALFLFVFFVWIMIHTTFFQNTLLNLGLQYLKKTYDIHVVVDGFEYSLFTHFKAKSIQVNLPQNDLIVAKNISIDVLDTFLGVKNADVESIMVKTNGNQGSFDIEGIEKKIKESLAGVYSISSFLNQITIHQLVINDQKTFHFSYLKEGENRLVKVQSEDQTHSFTFFKADGAYNILADGTQQKDMPIQGQISYHPDQNNLNVLVKTAVNDQPTTFNAAVAFNGDDILLNNASIQYGEYQTSLNGCASFKKGEDFSATIILDNQSFKGPFWDVLLTDDLTATISQKKDSWDFDFNIIKNNPITLSLKDNKYTLHIKQKSKNAFFEDSKIIYDAINQTLKGKMDIIGENIITFDQSFKGGKINGKIFMNIKDMAPLSTPFDLATVGRIKGDLIFKDFSIPDSSGFLNIDLHSKFFRSGYFKADLTTLKGKFEGNLDTDLTLESKDLTLGKYLFFLGKGFMAEQLVVTLIGKKGFYKLQKKAHAHKIGYLSSDVNVLMDVHFDKNKQQIHIQNLDFLHLKQHLKLQKPVIMDLNPLKITDVFLTINDKKVTLKNVSHHKNWSGSLSVEDIPLNILSWFFYKTMVVGTLSGSVNLSGSDDIPDFDLKIKGRDIQWGQFKEKDESNEEKINIDLSAQSISHNIKYDAALKSKKLVDLKINGHFNKQTCQCVDNAIKGCIDMSLISALFATGDRLCGPLIFDLNLQGTFDLPQWKGSITANKAYVELSEFGTVINNIQGKILTNGNKWTIQDLNAVDSPLDGQKKNPGTIFINGTILFKDLFTPLVDLKAVVKNYLVVDMDAISGKANGNLTIKGDGIFSTIKGDVDVQRLSIDLDRFHTEDGIPEIKLKDPKKRSFAKDYQKEHFTIAGKPLFPLDLTIKANNQFYMQGAIVSESVWGGEIKVLGPIDKAYLEGSLRVQKGLIDFFGKILKVEKGKVTFQAYERNAPQLHLEASRKVGDISVILKIDTSQDPLIQFDSSPSMSTDEILSWLLFGKSAGSVSAGQSIQLAAALAKLRGQKGFNLMDDFRKGIGLDTLEFREQENKTSSSFDTASNQVIHVGKKITDAIEVTVEQGAAQGTSKVGLEMDVGSNITLNAGVSREADSNTPNKSVSNSSVGLSWNKRY